MPTVGKELRDAQRSFLKSMGQTVIEAAPRPKKPGRPTKLAQVQQAMMRATNAEFFSGLLDDNAEKRLWEMFISAKAFKLDASGHVILGEDGFPILENVELNPIAWNAFKLAVAYKRGMPVIKTEDSKGKPKEFTLAVTYQGAGEDFFEKQAKAVGLLK